MSGEAQSKVGHGPNSPGIEFFPDNGVVADVRLKKKSVN
jgi:hypothetical protein